MLKFFRSVFMICICCIVIAGCGSTSPQYTNLAADPDFVIKIPERYFISDKETPADIKLVCTALLNKLRHRDETSFVRFDSIAEENVQGEQFNYEGFDITLIDITGVEAEKTGKDQSRGILEGVFHFKDFADRKASTYFAVSYLKTSHGITVTKAGTTNIPPLYPRVEAYFIPAEAFSKNQGVVLEGYWQMYAFALKNSLNMRPTQDEIQAYKAYQKMASWEKQAADKKMLKNKYVVMVFCLDRLSESPRFEVVVAGGIIKPRYTDNMGWPVAVFGGEFIADSLGRTFDILALYDREGQNEKYLVGKFINQKGYDVGKL